MIRKLEYRCFYEGQQEEMYFQHFSKLIKELNPNISIKFKKVAKLNTIESSSTSVPKLAIFDYDLNKIEFEKKVKICKKTRVLYSNLNFDLWLVLHKKKYMKNVQSNDAYVKLIKDYYNLPVTANIKNEKNIQKILEQINIEDIKRAITNAEEIMQGKLDNDKIYVKKGFEYYPNPSMSIHKFFKEIFEDLEI